MRNQFWSKWIRTARDDAKLTRRKLAESAHIEPSYVTLMERDGYVPRRDIVERLAKALGKHTNEALLAGGYAPHGLDHTELLSAMMVISKNGGSKRMRVLSAIDRERVHQDQKWGADRSHTPADWLAILTEELGEVAKAYNDRDKAGWESELVQVAAVAVCILESGVEW